MSYSGVRFDVSYIGKIRDRDQPVKGRFSFYGDPDIIPESAFTYNVKEILNAPFNSTEIAVMAPELDRGEYKNRVPCVVKSARHKERMARRRLGLSARHKERMARRRLGLYNGIEISGSPFKSIRQAAEAVSGLGTPTTPYQAKYRVKKGTAHFGYTFHRLK